MCEPRLSQRVFGLVERLLRLQHGDQIDRAFAQTLLRYVKGAPRARYHLTLQAFALCVLPNAVECILDVGKAGNDGLAVDLQQLILFALLQIEIAEKLATVKNRLCQAGGYRIDRRFPAAAIV